MGNTEDDLDDAQKVNEYASWYLSGLDSTGSIGQPTTDQVVNFSGPVNRLLPQMIQDSERKQTIIKAVKETEIMKEDDQGNVTNEISVETHDQFVVCGEEFKILGITIGQTKPTNCYEGKEKIRLSEWSDEYELSGFNKLVNRIGAETWNKRYPPLPWDDGTVENPDEDNPPKPFESQTAYQKAYREWRGSSCATIPGIDMNVCIDNPFVPNKWAALYPYVPLAPATDLDGKNYLLTGDGPNYVPSSGTEISGAQHTSYTNAPLYFAHIQEVHDLSNLLNKTYSPSGYENQKLPETTEQIKKGITEPVTENGNPAPVPAPLPPGNTPSTPSAPLPPDSGPYGPLDCSAVNVRVNEGDNLFPGDRPSEKEIFVENVKYTITQVKCDEIFEPPTPFGCGPKINGIGILPCPLKNEIKCVAQVGIEFKTGTKTPLADEIFTNTVAGTGATFRKIFPKVEAGAPVECIADIPTVTNVTYELDEDLTEQPNGGEQEFKQTVYPADGSNSGTQLTFPHIGSVYEYFLKGIQTALRPKGYGEPIVNGNCEPTTAECGEWETKLEKSSGGDCGICTSDLGPLAKRILATAGKAYNVPAANIWAAMKHEGGDWPEFNGQYTDENIRKWSTPIECGGEPMPSCDPNDRSSGKVYPPFGFLPYWFYMGDGTSATWAAVQVFDPSRTKDTISHCNFLDAAFASAKSLATWSAFSRTPISCYGKNMTSTSVPSCGSWSDDVVVQSHVGYWIGITPWCPDGTGGPMPPELGNNIPLPNYANDVLYNFKAAKCN